MPVGGVRVVGSPSNPHASYKKIEER
ncbi:hypothetical protein OOU_Y34scaffold00278g7 [Pyricularia oryzae Y34]|uniref:Uncharacterized protein n=1 Tax=Pyricularia oryzae (strain Y34) TaxID=1143189 RepID=A0AA97P3W3_PYRO3|nr:hypothetical protein OOU_Y34scaffold00278g7 [Pyricularia oryzae Y34]